MAIGGRIFYLGFSAKFGFFDVYGNSDCHIRIPQGFLPENQSYPEVFQLEKFCYGLVYEQWQ